MSNNKILITLVSDQQVPNLIFLKEFYNEGDTIIFLQTEKMKEIKKVNLLVDTLSIDESSYKIINISSYEEKDINEKLAEVYQEMNLETQKVLVNLTLGTKIMSLCVFNFFKSKNKETSFYYVDNNTIYDLFNDRYSKHTTKLKIQLEEYLNIYGLKIDSYNKHFYEPNITDNLIDFVVYDKNKFFTEYNAFSEELRDIRKKLKSKNQKKTEEIHPLNEHYPEIVESIFGINKALSNRDIVFLMGDFLEQWVYRQISKELEISEESRSEIIRQGVNCSKTQDNTQLPNEYDVLFIKNNQLNYIECKVFIEKGKKNDYLFKSDSLQKDFGLRPNTVFITCGEIPNDNDNKIFLTRLNSANIKLIQRQDIKDVLEGNKKLIDIILNRR